jgi:twitching motility protein PilT
MRVIATHIPDAEELGLPGSVIQLGERPHGLLLVVGPTGSGKSTTLACLVDRINRSRPCRIITVEDPIEYVHEGVVATVDQREVHADTKSFAAALKYILRQDPDVILVGEMRDLETVQAAVTAAETGHLVLATLHTNDAMQAIDRMVDVFPPHQQGQIRTQLAACLLGVVSQRLLQRADGNGRVAAFEIMVGTPAIRALVRENKMHQAVSLMEASRREGNVTMDAALQELVAEGIVAPEEAARYLRNARSLAAGGLKPDWAPPKR